MRKLNYIFLFFVGMFLLNSCLESESSFDLNDAGKNLAGFELGKTSVANIADGQEYTCEVKVKIVGPTKMDLTSDITLTIAADASSTAVEGVHYRIDNPSIVLKADNNYLGLFQFTMLTEGIQAPLAVSPKLVLKATSAAGDAMVINNGKPIEITMNYACYSNLAGTYDVATTIVRPVSGAVTNYTWTEDIKETGIGEYRTTYVGYAGYIPLGTGTDGFTFTDNCNVVNVPLQNLVDYYSNLVYGNGPGSVDPATGVITIYYTVETAAAAGFRVVTSVYTPVP